MGWGQPPSKQPGHVYKKLTWHEPDKKKKNRICSEINLKNSWVLDLPRQVLPRLLGMDPSRYPDKAFKFLLERRTEQQR